MQSFDLVQHLARQIAFSRATFGPGERTAGCCDHIAKELVEVLADAAKGPGAAATEWVDVVILALDGLTRSLIAGGHDHNLAPMTACDMIRRKQSINEQRDWPDWRTAPADKAIQHMKGAK